MYPWDLLATNGEDSFLFPKRATTRRAPVIAPTPVASAPITPREPVAMAHSTAPGGTWAHTAGAWIKYILGVMFVGSMMALGNWVFSIMAAQWQQSGMPEVPVMMVRPGSGAPQPQATTMNSAGMPGSRVASAGGGRPGNDWLNQYKD